MFEEHFEVFLADTETSKQIHYKIRYQVYCEEMGFENKDDFPNKEERDEYDEHSLHFIVRHKHSKAWVGAMRLIKKEHTLLPLEKNCTLNEAIEHSDKRTSVELSRLCLIKEIRRRSTDNEPPLGICTEEHDQIDHQETDKVKLFRKHRNNPNIIWGLLHAATDYGRQNNIHHCFFLTTSALARVLRKGGLTMHNIGSPIYHKGERFPFRMDVADICKKEVWRNYTRGYRLYSELDIARIDIAA